MSATHTHTADGYCTAIYSVPTLARNISFGDLDCMGKKAKYFTYTVHAQSTHAAEKVLFFAPHPAIHPKIQDQGQCGMPWFGVYSVPRL